LHGERAGALGLGAATQVHPRRAQHANGIEARVLEEAFVFRGEHRVDQQARDFVKAHAAAFFAGTGDRSLVFPLFLKNFWLAVTLFAVLYVLIAAMNYNVLCKLKEKN